MTDSPPTFSVGMEEEYLLVDLETRDLAVDPPAGLMADCKAALGGQVSPEFFRCQIEVATRPARSFDQHVACRRNDCSHGDDARR